MEEDEIFAQKAVLFRFSTESTEWLARAQGILKVLKNRETGCYRILMRQDQTYKVRANHHIPHLGSLHSQEGNDLVCFWTAFDYADNDEVRELFAVRFSSPKPADAFKAAFAAGQLANKDSVEKE
jgi:hypothetical protein